MRMQNVTDGASNSVQVHRHSKPRWTRIAAERVRGPPAGPRSEHNIRMTEDFVRQA